VGKNLGSDRPLRIENRQPPFSDNLSGDVLNLNPLSLDIQMGIINFLLLVSHTFLLLVAFLGLSLVSQLEPEFESQVQHLAKAVSLGLSQVSTMGQPGQLGPVTFQRIKDLAIQSFKFSERVAVQGFLLSTPSL
jgi:hypothetical protein